MSRSTLTLSFACLLACSGARETDERPAQSPVRPSASAAPLPSTAFRSDEENRAVQEGERAPISRFETRRIGAASEDGKSMAT